ncbi:MAG: DUF4166 domain-containing protein [Spongiibacteraceae bacterium]
MKSLMQLALGSDWNNLPSALQAHYLFESTADQGYLDIEYPRFMQPYLTLLRKFGALVNRSGRNNSTVVEKCMEGDRHIWRRKITYADGQCIRFNSFWISAGGNQLIEFVNPLLGLQMAVNVSEGKLYYTGMKFIVKLGPVLLPIPEWLVLGHTTIVEEAIGEKHFVMDFRLTHPLLGEIFRYSGKFETVVISS